MRITNPPERLDIHILRSYSTLRWCMAVLAFMLPLLLVLGGINSLWWISSPLKIQNSLSAYYHAGSICVASRGVYRDLFVGILSAISFCLIVYTGFGKLENWLLNIAGVCLACVAFFPMDWPETQVLSVCQATPNFAPFTSSKLLGLASVSIHGTLASIFFLMITLVNVITAMDTVKIIRNDKKREFWKKIFNIARFLMPISLGLVGLLWIVTGKSIIGEHLILWLEWAGIWAFSFYWLLKSIEIFCTKVDFDMINGKVRWISSGNSRKLRRLYQEVALTRDLPEYGLKVGDIAMLVDFVPHPSGGEEGCVLEVFNAIGESLTTIAVPISVVEALRSDEILSVRPLAKVN